MKIISKNKNKGIKYNCLSRGVKVLLCITLLLASGCKNDNDNELENIFADKAKPSWATPVDNDITSSMTAVIKVDLSLTYPEQVAALDKEIVTAGDALVAVKGDKCVGVSKLVNGMFFLYINGDSEDIARDVQLKYYSTALKNIFVGEETISFANDKQLGTFDKPITPKFIIER